MEANPPESVILFVRHGISAPALRINRTTTATEMQTIAQTHIELAGIRNSSSQRSFMRFTKADGSLMVRRGRRYSRTTNIDNYGSSKPLESGFLGLEIWADWNIGCVHRCCLLNEYCWWCSKQRQLPPSAIAGLSYLSSGTDKRTTMRRFVTNPAYELNTPRCVSLFVPCLRRDLLPRRVAPRQPNKFPIPEQPPPDHPEARPPPEPDLRLNTTSHPSTPTALLLTHLGRRRP